MIRSRRAARTAPGFFGRTVPFTDAAVRLTGQALFGQALNCQSGHWANGMSESIPWRPGRVSKL